METCLWKGISIYIGDGCLLQDSHRLFRLISQYELESPLEVDAIGPAACDQGLSKSMLYGESTLITWKLTVKDLRPISIISSISPCTSQRMPLKVLMIMAPSQIKDISTFKRSRVTIGKTFKADPLSISTLTTIMSSHLTTICTAKV